MKGTEQVPEALQHVGGRDVLRAAERREHSSGEGRQEMRVGSPGPSAGCKLLSCKVGTVSQELGRHTREALEGVSVCAGGGGGMTTEPLQGLKSLNRREENTSSDKASPVGPPFIDRPQFCRTCHSPRLHCRGTVS